MFKNSRLYRMLKRAIPFVLAIQMIMGQILPANAETELSAPSAILIEGSTGKVIYEKDATIRRSPASITKIMTLLLTFEQLELGKIDLQEDVLVSAYAASMGGSQVFLAEGEVQSLETMIKCIVVASGNDACVAVAEHIAGSEEAFVDKMNEKAKMLGMTDTHFVDCCGLTDSDEHYSTATDVAIMSRELITKYPKIYDYTSIWMEEIIHKTKQGEIPFTLSSTNKLLKQYQYTTGLKTGSTNKAMFCIAATARKGNLDLIAVVMGAPTGTDRFQDAKVLLNYGFEVCSLYLDDNTDSLPDIPVRKGIEESVELVYEGEFRYLDTRGIMRKNVEKILDLPSDLEAPIQKGEVLGYARYLVDGTELGEVPILAGSTVQKAFYKDCLRKMIESYLL